MLTMFRIRYEDVIVLTEWHMQPKRAVIADFENTISPYRVTSVQEAASLANMSHPDDSPVTPEFCITDSEVTQLTDTVRLSMPSSIALALMSPVSDRPLPTDSRNRYGAFQRSAADRHHSSRSEKGQSIRLHVHGLVGHVDQRLDAL